VSQTTYDAIIVGSGPNGLAAAIVLQQKGLRVLLIEGKDTIGGGLRTAELTLPGFKHDICSAIHPLAKASPFFRTLPLHLHGLEYLTPGFAAAHPFVDGTAAILDHSLESTAHALGADERVYKKLIQPLFDSWPQIDVDVLAPLRIPKHPLLLAQFGLNALQSATRIANKFSTKEAKGLWGGMAAHAIQPLTNVASAAIGFVLLAQGHLGGWPVPKGGSQSIANALASYFKSIGGEIQTGFFVKSLAELPSAKAIVFDVTPKQLLRIAGEKLSSFYKWQLGNYRYGMGVFKIDWALSEPIPFASAETRQAGTVHIGNTFEEIAESEQQTSDGKLVDKPFVLLAQQSLIDPLRAPAGKHTAWAYCHVPNGSIIDRTEAIEKQVERFAPGFRDTILARHVFNAIAMETYNPNYVGGDINGGILDVRQLYTRPALRWSPYRTSAKGIYICSSATPPGGGVHGMCGFHAANQVLKDVFGLTPAPLRRRGMTLEQTLKLHDEYPFKINSIAE